jgi:hypothetical protein
MNYEAIKKTTYWLRRFCFLPPLSDPVPAVPDTNSFSTQVQARGSFESLLGKSIFRLDFSSLQG